MFTTERNIKIEHSDISTFFICYLGYIYITKYCFVGELETSTVEDVRNHD